MPNLLSIQGDWFSENLCACLMALANYVVLGEARDRQVESVRQRLKVFRMQSAVITGKILAFGAYRVQHNGCSGGTAEGDVRLRLKLILKGREVDLPHRPGQAGETFTSGKSNTRSDASQRIHLPC